MRSLTVASLAVSCSSLFVPHAARAQSATEGAVAAQPAAALSEPPASPQPVAAQAPASAPTAPVVAQPAASAAPVAPAREVILLDRPPSQRYRHFSLSLLGGATIGAGYSPTINTTVGADLALSTELRVLYRGAVIVGSLGAKVTGVSLPMAPTGAALGVLLVPGVGGGYQFAVARAVSIGAVGRYNLSALLSASPQLQHTLSVDVPVTIHVGFNGLIEPYAQAGVVIGGLSTTGGTATSTQVTALVSGGLRFGVTL